jgi:hypothetical protein
MDLVSADEVHPEKPLQNRDGTTNICILTYFP